jgi:FtsH-binding integral membrane protein
MKASELLFNIYAIACLVAGVTAFLTSFLARIMVFVCADKATRRMLIWNIWYFWDWRNLKRENNPEQPHIMWTKVAILSMYIFFAVVVLSILSFFVIMQEPNSIP